MRESSVTRASTSHFTFCRGKRECSKNGKGCVKILRKCLLEKKKKRLHELVYLDRSLLKRAILYTKIYI